MFEDTINFTSIEAEEDFKNQLRHGLAEARRPIIRWWKQQQQRQQKSSQDQRIWRRAATARLERLWDYGVIPYEIEANFTGK